MTSPKRNVVNVSLKDRSYQIYIGEGTLGESGPFVRATCPKASRVLVISNKKVFGLYGRPLMDGLAKAGFEAHHALIGDGERFKSLSTAERLLAKLIELRFERNDAVVAVGGGVVGDVAGLVAALYQRGVDYVQVPTTLLAQIDSSVGGKTAVNHRLGKNLIGAFHQPRLVLIDPSTLTTLPQRELSAGLCEAIKYGVIRDQDLFDFIERNLAALLNRQSEVLIHLIARCCAIKAEVVSIDEREAGLRRILNFGHTIGHALEAVTNYRHFKHGEAVGYGMIAAARIARGMGRIDASSVERLTALVKASGRLPSLHGLNAAQIVEAMGHDKKMSGGKLIFILPDKIGEVTITQDAPLELIRAVIEGLIAED